MSLSSTWLMSQRHELTDNALLTVIARMVDEGQVVEIDRTQTPRGTQLALRSVCRRWRDVIDKALATTFDDLPDDMLHEIFGRVYGEGDVVTATDPPRGTHLTLRSVCRRWRGVADWARLRVLMCSLRRTICSWPSNGVCTSLLPSKSSRLRPSPSLSRPAFH